MGDLRDREKLQFQVRSEREMEHVVVSERGRVAVSNRCLIPAMPALEAMEKEELDSRGYSLCLALAFNEQQSSQRKSGTCAVATASRRTQGP